MFQQCGVCSVGQSSLAVGVRLACEHFVVLLQFRLAFAPSQPLCWVPQADGGSVKILQAPPVRSIRGLDPTISYIRGAWRQILEMRAFLCASQVGKRSS